LIVGEFEIEQTHSHFALCVLMWEYMYAIIITRKICYPISIKNKIYEG